MKIAIHEFRSIKSSQAGRRGHYTFPDNTIGERFPREKYIINLVHSMSNA
jgi:hypothetical protein